MLLEDDMIIFPSSVKEIPCTESRMEYASFGMGSTPRGALSLSEKEVIIA